MLCRLPFHHRNEFGYRAVQDKVPDASGLYTIYTARRWVYVGQSDDIRQSLFQHLNQPTACIHCPAGASALTLDFKEHAWHP